MLRLRNGVVKLCPAPFCTVRLKLGVRSPASPSSAMVKLSSSACTASAVAAAVRVTRRSLLPTPFSVASTVPMATPPKLTVSPARVIPPASAMPSRWVKAALVKL